MLYLIVQLWVHVGHLDVCGLAKIPLHHVKKAVSLCCANSGVPDYEATRLC